MRCCSSSSLFSRSKQMPAEAAAGEAAAGVTPQVAADMAADMAVGTAALLHAAAEYTADSG